MSNKINQYDRIDSPIYYNFLYCFKYSQICKNQNKNLDWYKFLFEYLNSRKYIKFCKKLRLEFEKIPIFNESPNFNNLIQLFKYPSNNFNEFLSELQKLKIFYDSAKLNDDFQFELLLNRLFHTFSKRFISEKPKNSIYIDAYINNRVEKEIYQRDSNNKNESMCEILSDFNLKISLNNKTVANILRDSVSPKKKQKNCSLVLKIEHTNQNFINDYILTKKLFESKMKKDFYYKQLLDNNVPLGWLMNKFIKLFLRVYSKKIGRIDRTIDDSIRIITSFVDFFKQVFVLYYNFQNENNIETYKNINLSINEIEELIISVIIDNSDDLYKILLTFEIFKNKTIENKIEENKKKIIKWKPEDFGVSSQYSLTENTKKLLSNPSNLNSSNNSDEEMILLSKYPDRDDDIIEDLKSNEQIIKKIFRNSHDEIIRYTYSIESNYSNNKKKNSFDLDHPFFSSIKILEEITFINNPFFILIKILEIAMEIISSIKNFHEELTSKEFDCSIDSDEIMSIFVFICSKCKNNKLLSKLLLTQNLITNYKATSIYGYYLSTLIAALNYLAEDDFAISIQRRKKKLAFSQTIANLEQRISSNDFNN